MTESGPSQRGRHEICAGLNERLLGLGEGVSKIALDIQLGRELFVNVNGHNNFRFDHRGAGQIARILRDILYDDDSTTRGRSAAKAHAEREASIWSEAAGKWADDEVVRIRRINQVKADPVVASHSLVKELAYALHQSLRSRCGGGEFLQFLKKLLLGRSHGRHPRIEIAERGESGILRAHLGSVYMKRKRRIARGVASVMNGCMGGRNVGKKKIREETRRIECDGLMGLEKNAHLTKQLPVRKS